jgi:Aspartyl/Asparaginyl beta-hydroxylase
MEPNSSVHGGWVSSYGAGDGHAIVFDDSFEHEVVHNGHNDRYVILVVLKHPQVLGGQDDAQTK